MAIETLRPNAAGDETNIHWQYPDSGSHYDKVDEVTPDEDATWIYESDKTTYYRDLYNLPAHSEGSGTINHITVYARARNYATPSQAGLKIAMKSGSTVDEGSEETLTTSYVNYSKQWTTNPDTGSAWTWSEIDSLQIGVTLRGGHTAYYLQTRCTQVWVEVDYTGAGATEKTSSDAGAGADAKASGNPIATLVKSETGSGSDVLSQAQAILDGVETGNGVDAYVSLQTSEAKTSSDAGSGADTKASGNPVTTLIKTETGSGIEALIIRLLAAFDNGTSAEASEIGGGGLLKNLLATELGQGSDSLTAKIEIPIKGGGMKLWT